MYRSLLLKFRLLLIRLQMNKLNNIQKDLFPDVFHVVDHEVEVVNGSEGQA